MPAGSESPTFPTGPTVQPPDPVTSPPSSLLSPDGVGDVLFPDLGNPGIDVQHYDVRLAYDQAELEVSGTVIERLDRPQADGQDASNEDEGDDDDSLASPLALAIDLDDNGSEPGAEPAPAPAEPSAAGA